MAVGNVEDYAEERGIEQVTLEVVRAQAESVGMGKFMRQAADGNKSFWRRLLRREVRLE